MSQAAGSAGHRRWLVWLPLLGAAAWLALFGDKAPEGDAEMARPVERPAPAMAAAASATVPGALQRKPAEADVQAVALPIPRETLIPLRTSDGDAPARDLFSARSWAPPPPPPAPVVAPPPVAPPVPFTFLGKKQEDGAWEVYLSRSEQTFVVREGQTLEGTWRVDKIAPPTLTLIYLPLEQVQTLSIGDHR